ncbi:gamma-glutamyl-gamma-aminobutyrate hydrolase family protein [Aurantimonas sp. HBX-1]|uniref:gamma-glutamyl-gamma-aminobutyrate hydrolase family protein n=1 Tax=Aurantimonas sp. HBX-1 TaxID=2906072 RepID=UPI001F1F2E18|nr:gamma-glutamyl-gamma-aminobutyrate hydrolase family protein [Aurantimonas sp. HBX-1]UIJ72764.1 gamma-glutamyl-gamma-aminobutyrate hydrolase family protein [Aurantimonas sp. HBX-1]
MTIDPILVAVPADVRDFENYRWHATPDTYLKALTRVAGAIPLIVPALADEFDVEALLSRVDGLMMTGSASNVHPDRYGVAATQGHEPFDPARDRLTEALIKGAIRRGLPLLCICRGHQELNVALGGTLATEIQEGEGRMDHRAIKHEEQRERFAVRHKVAVTAGGELAAIVGADEIRVNSLHRQAIDRLAPGLAVEATAEDGTIEAVSVEEARGFALGVQWHPEYWAESDAASAAIFHAFADACRAYKAGRGEAG